MDTPLRVFSVFLECGGSFAALSGLSRQSAKESLHSRKGRRPHPFFAAMHHRCSNVRMNTSPSEIASDEFVSSPDPSEFRASSSYFGFAANTHVSPLRVSTYSRPSAWTIDPHVTVPAGRFAFHTSSPVFSSKQRGGPDSSTI